ncbi:MAG: CPBP family glutamic-type intramembrane protease [Rudaea sp.]
MALKAVAGAVLIVASAWLLNRFAQYQVTHWLSEHSGHALVMAATGDTPYRWNLRRPADIVAGRVFGAKDFSFSDDTLNIRSNGEPFEVGMPLLQAVDLQRFPRLRIDAECDVPISVGVVVRQRLDSPQSDSAMTLVMPGRHTSAIDLSDLRWTGNLTPGAAPQRAAMLRLRVELPRGHWLHLHMVALERIAGFQRLALADVPHIVDSELQANADSIAVYRVPEDPGAPALRAMGNRSDVHAAILLLLPQSGRVEQQLQLRDYILDAVPAAIPIPQGAFSATFTLARAQNQTEHSLLSVWPLRWIALGLYVLLLIATRLRPPSQLRARAFLEVALALIGPLWLIAGDNFTGSGDIWQHLLIGVSIVYAISLYRPRTWRWNGSVKAWLLAAAVVVAAACMAMAMHHSGDGLRAIDAGHVVRYLAWAVIQQYLICAICTERWRIASGNAGVAVYLGALGFALLHTPNATLMLATFCGGLCWCALYLRERALLPLAASHAASALLLITLLPPDILRSAEVSARFFS